MISSSAVSAMRQFDRRVYGWRAMHAVSLGHLDSCPWWLGLEPGRKCHLPLGRYRRLKAVSATPTATKVTCEEIMPCERVGSFSRPEAISRAGPDTPRWPSLNSASSTIARPALAMLRLAKNEGVSSVICIT
jgi:hypothetical protein